MGITMMGGFMSWLWIVQAILIGVLFLGSNYYLWLGMERIPGAERFRAFIPFLVVVLALGFMVWATPRSLIASLSDEQLDRLQQDGVLVLRQPDASPEQQKIIVRLVADQIGSMEPPSPSSRSGCRGSSSRRSCGSCACPRSRSWRSWAASWS